MRIRVLELEFQNWRFRNGVLGFEFDNLSPENESENLSMRI